MRKFLSTGKLVITGALIALLSPFAVLAHSDAEAHTNPIYVIRGDQPIANTESLAWLLAKLDERIKILESLEDFEKKPDVLQYFNDCRSQLAGKL